MITSRQSTGGPRGEELRERNPISPGGAWAEKGKNWRSDSPKERGASIRQERNETFSDRGTRIGEANPRAASGTKQQTIFSQGTLEEVLVSARRWHGGTAPADASATGDVRVPSDVGQTFPGSAYTPKRNNPTNKRARLLMNLL